MKRAAAIIAAFAVAVIVVGYVSNFLSKRAVEQRIQTVNRDSIEQIAKLWHPPMSAPVPVQEQSILIRIDPGPDGKPVKYTLSPSAPLPFSYAHAKQVAPFVFRVHYGWAAGGKSMAFGEGGEKLVVSLFGRTKTLQTQPHWHF